MITANFKLVVLAFFVCIGVVGDSLAEKSESFKKVDSILREKGSNQEPTVYLDAIDSKLSELREENSTREHSEDELKDFIAALEQVSALRGILGKKSCNISEMMVMDLVAGDSDAHRYIEEGERVKLTGLDSLVHTVGLEHANYCQDKYLDLFESVYHNLDKDLRIRAEYKMNKFNELEKKMDKREFVDFLIAYEDDSKESEFATDASNHLLEMSEKDDKKVKCDFELIYRKYLLDPCQEYSTQIKEIVLPMKFDGMFFKDKTFFVANNESSLVLYKAMAQSEACSNVVFFEELESKVRTVWEENNSKDCLSLADRVEQKKKAERLQHRSLFDILFG